MSTSRVNAQVERQYVQDYVNAVYPNFPKIFNAKIGPIPTQVQGVSISTLNPNIYKVLQRYADAIVFLSDKVVIIEAKVDNMLYAVGQILYYRYLFAQTPEYQAYASLPVELQLVTPIVDSALQPFVSGLGITVVAFQTPQITQYLTKRLA